MNCFIIWLVILLYYHNDFPYYCYAYWILLVVTISHIEINILNNWYWIEQDIGFEKLEIYLIWWLNTTVPLCFLFGKVRIDSSQIYHCLPNGKIRIDYAKKINIFGSQWDALRLPKPCLCGAEFHLLNSSLVIGNYFLLFY